MEEKAGEPRVERIGGQLHEIRDVTNAAGDLLTQLVTPLKVEIKWQDIAQVVVGALAMGVPVAFSEEVWALGATLSPGRIVLIAFVSIVVLAFFVYSLFYRGNMKEHTGKFVARVAIAYSVTLLVCLGILMLIDKAPVDEFALAFKRAIIIALPASFAATAVDYMK